MNSASRLPDQAYLQLRERILKLDPNELGLASSATLPDVWGVMVEQGFEEGSATLVALADGTTSLHYSTGGGLLSRGDYEPLAKASRALVLEAQNYLAQMSPTASPSIPAVGQVQFILLTYAGIYTQTAPDTDLSSGKHALSSLYKCFQDTLNQLRSLAERKRK